MNKLLLILICALIMTQVTAQVEPTAGNWKTWFIPSAREYRLDGPTSSNKEELASVMSAQRNLDAAGMEKIVYWNAGPPSYRWHNMMGKLWMTDASANGILAMMLMGTATYDATIAAWDTKYTYRRARPFEVSDKVMTYALRPESPSYPCEHSVAAGVASTLIAHFFPTLKDSVVRMAQQVMDSRIAAGMAFPSDTRAGFELGKRIAEREIEMTKDFLTKEKWDGKVPQNKGGWTGKFALFPLAGLNKTVALKHPAEFRPGPPPDFAKEMEELKNFKQTFKSQANAWHYASQSTTDDLITKKIFEYNLHLNPPRAERLYAAAAVSYYDAFTACFEAKYTYWGIRPEQYDPTYKPLFPSPPFPGYPSGHAVMSGVAGELFSHFFPAERDLFNKIATDGAESRFHAGIHFRSDNDAGLELGRKVAGRVIERLVADGAENGLPTSNKKETDLKAKRKP